MLDRLIDGMKVSEGVTERLKAENQMAWMQAMSSIRNWAEEVIYKELIFA